MTMDDRGRTKEDRYREQYTLYGDLDGMTVGELKKMLSYYNDSDRIDVLSWTDVYNCENDYFVIKEVVENND